jgi:hypothetical protein
VTYLEYFFSSFGKTPSTGKMFLDLLNIASLLYCYTSTMPAETINIEHTYLTRGHTYFLCDRKFVANEKGQGKILPATQIADDIGPNILTKSSLHKLDK